MQWPPTLPKSFPLTVTKRGYVKRIKGRLRWIAGKVAPDKALATYHRKAAALTGARRVLRADDVPANLDPPAHWLINRWLLEKQREVAGGQLRAKSYTEYRASLRCVNDVIGEMKISEVTPDVLKETYRRQVESGRPAGASKRAVGHFINAVVYGAEMGWCGAPRFTSRVMRKLKLPQPGIERFRLYSPDEIRHILAECCCRITDSSGVYKQAWIQLRAMILLALNGGLGASECAALTRDVVDLDRRLLDFDRGKTQVQHFVPLWDETCAALRAVLDLRLHDKLVFLTRHKTPWVRAKVKHRGDAIHTATVIDNVADRFNDLIEPLGLKFPRQSFYRLKHLHCTLADEAQDRHATFPLAGHALPGSKTNYVRVSEARVRAVVQSIHDKLFSSVQ